MPRRRNNGLISLVELQDEETSRPQDQIRMVKSCLKDQVWDMMKETNRNIECPICLDAIDCKRCFCLMDCSHMFHLSCVIKCETCPMCRGNINKN